MRMWRVSTDPGLLSTWSSFVILLRKSSADMIAASPKLGTRRKMEIYML